MKKPKLTILLTSLTAIGFSGCVDVNIDPIPDINVPLIPFIQNENNPDEHPIPNGAHPQMGGDETAA